MSLVREQADGQEKRGVLSPILQQSGQTLLERAASEWQDSGRTVGKESPGGECQRQIAVPAPGGRFAI